MSNEPVPNYEERFGERKPSGRAATTNEDGDDWTPVPTDGSLPSPAGPNDVRALINVYNLNKTALNHALSKLKNPTTIVDADQWKIGMYMLLPAFCVNWGWDPLFGVKPAPRASRLQNEQLVYAGATALNLNWVPFIDLALTPWTTNPLISPASGPYAGVFVSRGDDPIMILAFKGTTYAWEVTTDALWTADKFRPDDDVVYKNEVHQGMGRSLFMPFAGDATRKDAFEIIWEKLELEAARLKGTSDRKIPLYVVGHSLGAGYATLEYMELVRRVDAEAPTSWTLHDCWVYGSPRVFKNEGAKKMRDILGPHRHLYRPANKGDNVPAILLPGGWRHCDIGYKLDPTINSDVGYVTMRESEIDAETQYNDTVPATDKWQKHWPQVYIEGIQKVLDNPTET